VEEFAKQQGLIYDAHGDFGRIFRSKERARLAAVTSDVYGLGEHCVTFKPRGSGTKQPVVAVTHAYAPDTAATRAAVASYARAVGLNVRVNEPGDRLRFAGDEIVVVFWRPEHEIEAPLRR